MRLLLTGSRSLTPEHYPALKKAIEENYPQATEIWTGGARGADELAEHYAREKGLRCCVIRPNYSKYSGQVAPLQRNIELVRATDATLAVYCGKLTGGTNHTAHWTLRYGHELTTAALDTGRRKHWPADTSGKLL